MKRTSPLVPAICPLLLLAALTGCHHAPPLYDTSTLPPPPAPVRREPAVREPEAGTPARESSSARSSAREDDPARGAAPEASLAGRRFLSEETGLASWYGPPYHNHQAADGSIYDQNSMTAAHRTLPMGTVVRVTNLATGQSVVVKITDRGPFVPNRILDLSLAAARATGLYQQGTGQVRVDAYARDAPDDGGRWCVQIGAFLTADDSIQLQNDLIRRFGASAKVIQFAGPTGHWVRINPVESDRKTAERIAASIHVPDADPYVVRLN